MKLRRAGSHRYANNGLRAATTSHLAPVSIGVLIVTATARATPATSEAGAEARAFAIKITVPGQGVFYTTEASAPPDEAIPSAPFVYPADGSVVRIDATAASASATASGGAATGTASSELTGIQLFGGEIAIGRVLAYAIADATPEEATGDTTETVVEGATYLGQPLAMTPGGRIELGDWGYIQALVTTTSGGDPGTQGSHQSMQALDLHVVVDHGGLAAGSEIVIGWADALAQSETQTSPVTIPKSGSQPNSETSTDYDVEEARQEARLEDRQGAADSL